MQTKVADRTAGQGTGVAVRGVGRRFKVARRDDVRALAGVDLEVGPGEVLGVVGPSGCGKSTLLELIAGLQEPDGGSIRVAGTGDGGRAGGGGDGATWTNAPGAADPTVAAAADPTGAAGADPTGAAARRAACSYMPQRDLLLPWRDALGNAALALECQGVSRKEARRRAGPLFHRFGLGEFEAALPAQLSGGMRQRVAFMRTLLPGRPVLLLDEPFASLDSITRASMQQWLADALAAEPRTVVLVTHDVEEALFLSDRVAVLSPRPGRVLEQLDVPLRRPRDRRAAVTGPELARLRERALGVLGA